MKRLLFIHTVAASYVKSDLQILQSKFNVKSFFFNPNRKKIVNFFLLTVFLLKNIPKSQIVYTWFASTHSLLSTFLAKIMGKKAFIVLGGYDVAQFPEIGYGTFSNKFRSVTTKLAIYLSHYNIAVSKYVKNEIVKRFPHLNKKTVVIYNGINTSFQEDLPTHFAKEDVVLCVANIHNEQRMKIKGIDRFFRLAQLMPQTKFVIIGVAKSYLNELKKDCPKNLRIHPPVSLEDLKDHYARAKIYCLLSIVESFGMSVIEAMMHGCIPIVSNTGALPEIINNFGYSVNRDNLPQIKNLIENVFCNYSNYDVQKMKKYVLENYSIRIRKQKLLHLITHLKPLDSI